MDAAGKSQVEKYILALEKLMSRKLEGKAGTLFAGGGTLTKRAVAAFNTSAAKFEVDIVYLEFGPEIAKGPRKVKLIMPRDGACHLYSDCVLWCDGEGGPVVIVPRKGVQGHFRIDSDDELVHHEGRPAASLGEGMIRADARLLEAVAGLPAEASATMAHISVKDATVTTTLGGREVYRTAE